jgi:hypothetical protein
MKGDFSRIRFNPAKHYTAVLEQQGRVSLDADSNEQQAIDATLRETTNIDVIGQFGGPIGDAGFAIEVVGAQIFIEPGRYYVDGILVENPSVIAYDAQPTLIGAEHSAIDLLEAILRGKDSVSVQMYLEVWQRLITQLDDPCLREPALGQADTTARLQTVWRVVGVPRTVDANGNGTDSGINSPVLLDSSAASGRAIANLSTCCQSMYATPVFERTGALGADTGNSGSDCGCQPIPAAGYQGLENQLYRVEIHTSGTLETATFNWSRENASIVTQVTAVNGAVVTASGLGPDANLGFQIGQWVELTDDTYIFGQPPNQSGSLYQISGIQCSGGQFLVTLSAQVMGLDPARNARMRRWDQSGPSIVAAGIPLSAAPIQLENGIEVSFREGTYVAGDYWTIPARTASGQIDWPPCGGNGNFFQPAHYTRIHHAPLACIHIRSLQVFRGPTNNIPIGNLPVLDTDRTLGFAATNEGGRFQVDDCRLLFPPLTGVSANAAPPALHIETINWVNDDVMSVDTFIANGLFLTLDQPPSCPWGGGNFQVMVETPISLDTVTGIKGGANGQDPTEAFLRTVFVLDDPEGITVSGAQVTWLLPYGNQGRSGSIENIRLYIVLNAILKASNSNAYARVRVKLFGSQIYATAAGGNIYLDGESFGLTGIRVGDGSPSIQLQMPSGSSERASDFESWFYLAPSVRVASVIFQGLENGNETTLTQIWVNSGTIQNSDGAAAPAIPILNFEALITLTSTPVTDTVVTLSFSGVPDGWIVSIAPSVVVPAGQMSVTAPITVLLVVDAGTITVTLLATLGTPIGSFPMSSPQLVINAVNVIF